MNVRVCSWPSQELSENPTQQPKTLIHLGHRPNFPTLWFEFSLSTNCLAVSLLTYYFGVPLLTDLCPSSCRFSQAQLFVWYSRQYRPRKVYWTLRRYFKDAGDKMPGPPIDEHTERPTHIHLSINLSIYIYIVIHGQICFVLSELISEARHTSFP